jgi:hypothetical protein
MHEDGFHGEDRRESERRDPPPPMHVSVDQLSNGVLSTVRSAEAKFDRAVEVGGKLMKLGIGLIVSVLGGMFALGVWYHEVNTRFEARPTREATRQMIEEIAGEKYDALIEALAENAATDRVDRERSTNSMVQAELALEALEERTAGLRRDVDRIDRRVP